MANALRYYKKLYKNVNRLPVDLRTLTLAKNKLRQLFRNGKMLKDTPIDDPERWRRAMKITDSLLKGDYKQFPCVLDLLYKEELPPGSWMKRFLQTKYSAFKSIWPEVHLLHEFGKEKHINLYNKELQKTTPGDFSLMKEMKLTLPPGQEPLKLLRTSELRTPIHELLSQVKKFHHFVSRHFDVLLNGRPKPFELLYEPTRYGLPKSIAARERDLRMKVNYMKEIVNQIGVISRSDASHLVAVAIGTSSGSDIQINPNYFRYMTRTHKSRNEVSPYERRYLRQKQLVPNERNIRYHFREYASKQVYEDENGSYKLSTVP